jgi:hypothetical protein
VHKTLTGPSLLLLAGLCLLPAPDARAACRPPDGATLDGDLTIRAQLLVAPEAARPWVVVRCYLEGAVPDRIVIPVLDPELVPHVMTLDGWDRLWIASAPRVLERGSAGTTPGEVPRHDLDPPVVGVLAPPPGRVLDADVALEAAAPGGSLPEATQALVVIAPRGAPARDGAGVWTPSLRLPLARDAEGRPLLPLLPEGEIVGRGGRATIETTLIVLGATRYWALAGFDLWDAIDREPHGLATSSVAVTPHPVLVVPDLRVGFNRQRADGFAAFYERRVDEVAEGAAFPLAVLQYAGSLGRRDALLPQPEPLEWYTEANRLVRVRLDRAAGRPLPLVEIPPTLYLPVWVTRALDEVVEPSDPSDLDLGWDTRRLFGSGAERLGELTPTMVRGTIEQNLDRVMACDPGGTEPVLVDLQLMVEPGGTTVGVFAGVSHATVGQCLIDTFSDTLFPIATGSPVGVRFPVAYQHP